MRTKSFIAVCGLLVVLFAAAAGTYAYDSSRANRIAAGVMVNGIDVGGLEAAEAREVLRERLLTPLNRPVVVRHKGRRFTLTPERARVAVDIDRSVDAAVRRSREAGLLSRAFRDLTGGDVRAEVPVSITYDRSAVSRLVGRVRKAVDRAAVDADVSFDGGNVAPKPSKEGIAVRTAALRREVGARLTSLTGARTVKARTRVVKPKVTTGELADRYPAVVIVNRSAFKLTLYRNLEPAKTYRIAVGQAGRETPAGLYNIQNKAVNPTWNVPDSDWAGELAGKVIPPDDPRNPIEARWMGIYDGAGIHGTEAVESLGTAASRGCIRMAIPDVIELYDQVPLNAPVYIS